MGFHFNSKSHSHFSLVLFLWYHGLDAQEPNVYFIVRSRLHTSCVKPAPPDMFAPCWFSSLLLADICWCCLGSCEGWPGAGCPATQDSCLQSPAPAPRTEPLTTQEHGPQGTRGLPGCRMPVLSSVYFLEVVVRVSDSDCFRSAI